MFSPNFPDQLRVENKSYRSFLADYAKLFFSTDRPDYDLATQSIIAIAGKKTATFKLVALEPGIFSGLEELNYWFTSLGIKKVNFRISDGDYFSSGQTLLVITGELSLLLSYERFFLNYLTRVLGITTKCHSLQKRVETSFTHKIGLASTRKSPLILIDKKAALIGGVLTHRLNLEQAAIYKDNHQGGGLDEVLEAIERLNLTTSQERQVDFVEIEIDKPDQLPLLIDFLKPRIFNFPVGIMFDNFRPSDLKPLLEEFSGESALNAIFLEASGGINEKNLEDYDLPRLNLLSSSMFTNNFQAIDLSFELESK